MMRQLAQRVTLQLLRGYKAIVSPLFSARLPVRANLFRIRDGGGGAVRRVTRWLSGGWAIAALPSVCEGRIRSGGEARENCEEMSSAGRHHGAMHDTI